jgi:nucleotide-binding universal stress UspA family protein
MPPKKIMVCTDFSENSTRARITALDYAKAFDAQLVIYHVVNSRLIGYPTFANQNPEQIALVQKNIEDGVSQELDLLVNDARREFEKVTSFSASGAPAEEIVQFANQNGIELIIMGTHGWTGMKHMILGSTAENVVRTANCPVLTVRSEAQ